MNQLDALIEESRAIHDDLLKTIGRLQAFSQALSAEAGKLRDEIGGTNAGDSATGNESSSSASPDPEEQRAGFDKRDTAGE